MRYPFYIFTLIILWATACTTLKNIFYDESTNNLVKLENSIIEELQNQNYDIIKSITNDNSYYVKASINNNNLSMILDTGAIYTLLKSKNINKYQLTHIDELEPILLKPAFSESIEFIPAKADSFKIGTITFNPWPFLLSNNLYSDGILGCEFLHFTKSIIICNPGVLCISLNSKAASKINDIINKDTSYKEIDLLMAQEDTYIKINQQVGDTHKLLESGLLMVPITVDEICGYALIDTGASSSLLDLEKLQKNNLKGKIYSRFSKDAIGKKKRIYSKIFNKFLIDKYPVEDDFYLSFTLLKKRDLYINNKSVAILGIIGLDILYKKNAIIDFGNRKLYLQIQ